jgi:FkbH-like protein
LLELKEKGIALILLSKNNEAEVEEAFSSLPPMILKLDDFAVRKINWKAKPENLREAAQELRLGLDSFVFVDDSDFEREQMRQFLPEVMILNDNSDPLHTLRCLWETDAFDTLSLTEEDQLRHRDYTVRAARDVQAHQHDLNTFLESLEMVATIERVGPANLERVVTLLGKTNQFNLTTRRHSRAEVQAILETPGSIALVLRLKDKFGEQGIVALLLAVPTGRNATLSVDTLLVSCRALGRGVEHALWAAMIKRAVQQGIQSLEAEYRATGKNGMVADFYDQIGLQCIKSDSSSASYYSAKVDICPSPVWINLRDPNNEG